MTIAAQRIDVDTEATRLSSSDRGSTAGQSVLVRVPSDAATSVVVGGPGVTSSTGVALAAGESLEVALDRSEALYGVVATGSVTVQVLEQGI